MNEEIYDQPEPLEPSEPSTNDLQLLAAPKSDEGGSTASAAAQRAFLLLDRLDFKSRRKSPSVISVFRLYCMENLTVTEIARQCRCSLSTVSDRLKVLRRRTGLPPKSFRK